MTPLLFTPLSLGSVTVPNRIAIAPMCQYSADDGSMTDWHLQHVMRMGMSGAGLVIIEATAVERRGRMVSAVGTTLRIAGLDARIGDQCDIPLEVSQQPTQVSHPATNVLFRIEWFPDVEAFSGFRNQLHQALRIFW